MYKCVCFIQWHLSGFIVEISSTPIIGVVVLLLGTIVIVTVCVLNWKILHAKDLEEAAIRNANKKEEVAPKEVVENDNDDDDSDDPSLENLNQTIYTNLENVNQQINYSIYYRNPQSKRSKRLRELLLIESKSQSIDRLIYLILILMIIFYTPEL